MGGETVACEREIIYPWSEADLELEECVVGSVISS